MDGKKAPSIRKNFTYSTLYQLLSVITPFITAPYISRVLGPDGVGIQSYTGANVTYFSMCAALGTSVYGAKTIAELRDDPAAYSKAFWEIELMQIATSLVSIAAWIVFTVFSGEYRPYYAILTTMLLATMLDITWFFNGLEEFRLVVIRNSIFKILGVVCIFLFVKDTNDVGINIAISGLTGALSSASLWPYLKRFLRKVEWKKLNIWQHFSKTMLYFIPTIASSIYLILDKTLIGLITHNAAENGFYQQAQKIIDIGKSVVFIAINSIMTVRMAYLFKENQIDEIHRRIEESINYILFMGFGCAFGIIGVAKNFVPLFFGEGYEPVVQILSVFSPILVIIGISNCVETQFFTPSGRRKESIRFLIIGAGMNLLLNLLMIPKLGSLGAAIASVLAELLITVLYVKNSRGYMTARILVRTGWKKLLAGVVMCAAVYAVGNLRLPSIIVLIIQIVFGVTVYGALLLLMKDAWVAKYVQEIWEKLRGKMAHS